MRKTYKIFGNLVQINLLSGNEIQKQTLLQHFALYDESEEEDSPNLIINIHKGNIPNKTQALNPKIHIETERGFISSFPKMSVGFENIKPLKADLSLDFQKKGILKYLKRLYNIQYNTIDQRISQILHELVLIPAVYFDPRQFLVHSSAFKKNSGGAVLIGGTGGVGKTSLEIELCMNRDYSFIADDISVLDDEGNIWPNLSFPKIYAYNLKNNEDLKTRIFKNRRLSDKLAWKLKYMLNGASGVRRNISPEDAFEKFEKNKTKIDKYYILIKTDVEEISIQKINAQKASEMSISVIQAEYFQFNNHILWHEFNCNAINKIPILKLNDVLLKWKSLSEKVFKNIDCYVINVPLHIDHKKFVKETADIID